jgi:hypothetical protein
MQDVPVVRSRHVSGKAVAALALSTVFSLIPLIPSAAAVIVGTSARREIRSDRSLAGAGMAGAGVILGLVGTLVWLALILAGIFFIDEARSLS